MAKPRDRREYVRVSVNLPTNPKVAGLNHAAGWLYVCGLCWSGENLTDGQLTPRIVERLAGVPARWSKALIAAGLWHPAGHDCEVCAQPPAGQVIIHDYLEHQRSRSDADKARSDGRAAAGARWDAKRNANGNANRNALPNAEAEAEAEERSFLLTLITRLAAGDARGGPPPAEVIDSWQEIAGPGVDLNAEAMRYLARYGDQPANDERNAWLGWLRKAGPREQARHEAAGVDPDADIRPPTGCGHGECQGGYLGLDAEERPIPCPRCRPHLRPMEAS